MSCSPARRIIGILVPLLVACTDPSLTAVTQLDLADDPYAPLPLAAPWVTQDQLISLEVVEIGDRELARPLRVEGEDDFDRESQPAAQIFSPKTTVGFQYGAAFSEGQHSYNGNVARVESTASLMSGSTSLGTHTAARQESVWFPFQLGQRGFIHAYAQVFSEAECGVRVSGSSKHLSWFEFFQGVGVPSWGETEESSTTAPVALPDCEEETEVRTGLTGGDSGSITCFVNITYDVNTGEVLNVEILSCWTEEE